ncbi:SET domain-containing protein [Bacillus cereus]|uniref:SET domain-containing protein n=1 Tax=Bacillus cereus TaxID=1396 RepID=UPI000BF7FB2F|nr:SET domain-containing protein [Bacillus cereus]PEQ60943.1 SET domain-containing protein-lysine N-methyltransferase [Bacillus cereus]
MMHPDTKLGFVNETIGYGVFATKFIPKGTIVWILDDLEQVLDKKHVDSLDSLRKKVVKKYSYQNNKNQYILSWDHGKYVNHSFYPNMVETVYEFELAARDIYPGEELTCDYSTFVLDEPFECLPENGSSRTKVMPDDYLHYYQKWDQMAQEAFQHFNTVNQPLKYLISKRFVKKVNEVADNPKLLDSILSMFN